MYLKISYNNIRNLFVHKNETFCNFMNLLVYNDCLPLFCVYAYYTTRGCCSLKDKL